MRLSVGGSIHDPTDPVGPLRFNVLAMVAEFEADLTSMRTREGMKVAKAKGRLRGKQPKLSKIQSKHLVELNARGVYTTAELAELFRVSRATVYRTIHREPPPPNDLHRPFAHTPCTGHERSTPTMLEPGRRHTPPLLAVGSRPLIENRLRSGRRLDQCCSRQLLDPCPACRFR